MRFAGRRSLATGTLVAAGSVALITGLIYALSEIVAGRLHRTCG